MKTLRVFFRVLGVGRPLSLASNGTLVFFSAGHSWFMLYEGDALGIHQNSKDERASSNPKWGRIDKKFWKFGRVWN